MITIRRAGEAASGPRDEPATWLTFALAPGRALPRHSHPDGEVVTYVREGALAYVDSNGHAASIEAGEFQRMSARRGVRHGGTNVSGTTAQVFQLWLRAIDAPLQPGQELERFSAAQRRGGLCVVASSDGRGGSLRLHQDSVVYSAILDPGQHVVHALADGRSASLHLLRGEVTVGGFALATGDRARVTGERAVSLTARSESELLFIDLCERTDELDPA